MRLFIRLAFAACAALLLSGVGGVIAQHTGSSKQSTVTTVLPTGDNQTGPAGTAPATTAPVAVTPSVPSEDTLQAELIVPNDLGGYYTPIPSDSASQLAASGCLAALGQPPAPAHQALQYLRGPYEAELPFINEQVSDFTDAQAATAAYTSLASRLRACRAPAVSLPTGRATVDLAPLVVPDLGDQATAAQGDYVLDGRHGQLTAAVVRAGGTLVVFEYADSVPASNPILGTVISTLRASVGKATP